MSARRRPPPEVRLSTKLAAAVLEGRQAEAHELAKRLEEIERRRTAEQPK